MAGRQMAARPKVLASTPPPDVPDDVDDDEIDADEQAAAERARRARRPPAPSSTSPKVAAPKLKSVPASTSPKPKTRTSRPRSSSKSRTSGQKSAPARVDAVAHNGAGVLLGFVAYALFLAYVKGGWSGVKQWLAAKFTNNDPGAQSPNQAPGAKTNAESLAWIAAHPCQAVHPGKGPSDFWNAIAISKCKAAGGTMQPGVS